MNDKQKMLFGRVMLSFRGLEDMTVQEQVQLVELIHNKLIVRIKGHIEAERDTKVVDDALNK